MNAFKKIKYNILSASTEHAPVTDMSTDELLVKVEEDAPELMPWVLKLQTGEITTEEFNRVCIGHIVKGLYSFRKESEDSRMRDW